MGVHKLRLGNYIYFYYAANHSRVPVSVVACMRCQAYIIAIGVIAESLSRSPFSVERPAPPGQWKCKLKCTISIAVSQRLRYIVSYGILSHSHSICIAFVLHCIALYGTTLYDKL